MKKLPRYLTTDKAVGETPLVATERLRALHGISNDTPLAYAGRLDPMASGKLLILVGDECKIQEKYHKHDKEYEVTVLLGISSDSGDVLGLLSQCPQKQVSKEDVRVVLTSLVGPIELPYPHFSSKTVQGKPLHVWALEKRLNEIEIPIKKSTIHRMTCTRLRTISKKEILETVRAKIETIPEVTEATKALGADFRRNDVRKTWNDFEAADTENYQVLTFTCIASSGTYMRSLAASIGTKLGTCGLAYSIHRTKIGTYRALTKNLGFWSKKF